MTSDELMSNQEKGWLTPVIEYTESDIESTGDHQSSSPSVKFATHKCDVAATPIVPPSSNLMVPGRNLSVKNTEKKEAWAGDIYGHDTCGSDARAGSCLVHLQTGADEGTYFEPSRRALN